MSLLITGADHPLGILAARSLAGDHALRLTGAAPGAVPGLPAAEYVPADLRWPEQVEPLLRDVSAVLHLAPYEFGYPADPAAAGELLDHAGRGTFVLLHAARRAGVPRLVLASRLELMEDYGEECVVSETWQPRPRAEAGSLAPFLAELTAREFVRSAPLTVVCLRFGELGEAGTTEADAAAALRRALEADFSASGHRWWLFHLGSTARYPRFAAAQPPFSFSGEGAACRP